MIRNLFVLVFAVCLTGISRGDKDFGFKNTAYDTFNVYDEYEGSQRMQYSDYDPSDRNEDEAGLNRNDAEGNRSSESIEQSGGVGRPPINATNAAKVMSPKVGGANAKQVVNKMPAKNKSKGGTASLESAKTPANNNPKGAIATKPKGMMETQITKTKQTANTSANGTDANPFKGTFMKLPGRPKVAPKKKRFVTIQYYYYKQNDNHLYVQEDLRILRPNKDIYIMLHGFMESKDSPDGQDSYIDYFFKSLSSAILSRYDVNVVGMKWSFEPPNQPKPFVAYRAAIIAGKKLGNAINALRSKGLNARLTVIGHDLGNLAAASLAGVLKKPVDYIYGLDQRLLPGKHRDFYLRQDSGKLVQTIVTNGMKYNYGHRNFYPNGGNLSSVFGYEDQQCYPCHSFHLLIEDIVPNGRDHSCTFCSNYDDYINDYCEHFPQVSYFNRFPADQLPIGNYFITETTTKNRPLWDLDN